jgi:hypothetical protein
MFSKLSRVSAVLFFAFLLASVFSAMALPGAQEVVPVLTSSMQPSGSDTITWASGSYLTKARNGAARIARGLDVKPTSTGGNLKIHILNDYDSRGRKCWLTYPIPAGGGVIQRIGYFFDEVDSAGTTILKTDVIIWY